MPDLLTGISEGPQAARPASVGADLAAVLARIDGLARQLEADRAELRALRRRVLALQAEPDADQAPRIGRPPKVPADALEQLEALLASGAVEERDALRRLAARFGVTRQGLAQALRRQALQRLAAQETGGGLFLAEALAGWRQSTEEDSST